MLIGNATDQGKVGEYQSAGVLERAQLLEPHLHRELLHKAIDPAEKI
jgi:hypothetical protein